MQIVASKLGYKQSIHSLQQCQLILINISSNNQTLFRAVVERLNIQHALANSISRQYSCKAGSLSRSKSSQPSQYKGSLLEPNKVFQLPLKPLTNKNNLDNLLQDCPTFNCSTVLPMQKAKEDSRYILNIKCLRRG